MLLILFKNVYFFLFFVVYLVFIIVCLLLLVLLYYINISVIIIGSNKNLLSNKSIQPHTQTHISLEHTRTQASYATNAAPNKLSVHDTNARTVKVSSYTHTHTHTHTLNTMSRNSIYTHTNTRTHTQTHIHTDVDICAICEQNAYCESLNLPVQSNSVTFVCPYTWCAQSGLSEGI